MLGNGLYRYRHLWFKIVKVGLFALGPQNVLLPLHQRIKLLDTIDRVLLPHYEPLVVALQYPYRSV